MRLLACTALLLTAAPGSALSLINVPAGSSFGATAGSLGTNQQFLPPGRIKPNGVGGGPGPVPEPASWAMFIAGLGTLGIVMRRRRSASHA